MLGVFIFTITGKRYKSSNDIAQTVQNKAKNGKFASFLFDERHPSKRRIMKLQERLGLLPVNFKQE